ncbi:MAG: IS110 family transposase [Thermoplasmata archaeon]
MRMYAGVDVHRGFCQTTVMDEQGAIVERARIPTDTEHLTAFFERYRDAQAVVESNTIWEFVYETLDDLGLDVCLASPAQVKAIAQARVKTDTVDATTLAHLLRTNLIPEAWVGDEEVRELRKDVRARRGLRDISTELKNQIYAEMIRKGIAYEDGVLRSKKGRAWVRDQFADNPRVIARLDLMEQTETTIDTYNKTVLLPKFTEESQAPLLATIPGVGYYTALTVVALIGDVTRFPDSDHLVSYAGLAPRVRQSATTLHLGPITKEGPSELRWVLVEAVHSHLKHCNTKEACTLCGFYRRLSRRRGQMKATVATAAKLLRVMYWMLKMNQPYRPQGLDPEVGHAGEPPVDD